MIPPHIPDVQQHQSDKFQHSSLSPNVGYTSPYEVTSSCSESLPSPSASSQPDHLQGGVLPTLPEPLPNDKNPGGMTLGSPSDEKLGVCETSSLSPTSEINAVDAALSSTSLTSSLTSQTKNKQRHRNLHLPSFETLGIACPRPDLTNTGAKWPLLDPETPASAGEVIDSSIGTSRNDTHFTSGPAEGNSDSPIATRRHIDNQNHNHRMIMSPQAAMLTPPAEMDLPEWEALRANSHPNEQPSQGRSADFHPISQPTSSTPGISRSSNLATTDITVEHDWLNDIAHQLFTSLTSITYPGNQMKFLSQALPSPRVSGHNFPDIINLIRSRLPSSPLMWINLLHAVPGRFNLADLPTSPPSTPGMPVGGDDYFTSKVFDNAVTAVDYEATSSGSTTPARPYTYPLAIPASINLAIIERYIPPTSLNELADLYDPYGSSMLTDRLVEISSSNGCLTFIYPTKIGGETFASSYLGPILDPILRSMVVIHNLSSDFSSSLGQMTAVNYLHAFDLMLDKIRALCHQLNAPNEIIHDKLQGIPGHFTIAYAAPRKVLIERHVWADWWVKQEKPRIRNSVRNYFRTASRLPEIQQTTLIQEIFDGVLSKADAPVMNLPPIEVGVFIIRRQEK